MRRPLLPRGVATIAAPAIVDQEVATRLRQCEQEVFPLEVGVVIRVYYRGLGQVIEAMAVYNCQKLLIIVLLQPDLPSFCSRGVSCSHGGVAGAVETIATMLPITCCNNSSGNFYQLSLGSNHYEVLNSYTRAEAAFQRTNAPVPSRL